MSDEKFNDRTLETNVSSLAKDPLRKQRTRAL